MSAVGDPRRPRGGAFATWRVVHGTVAPAQPGRGDADRDDQERGTDHRRQRRRHHAQHDEHDAQEREPDQHRRRAHRSRPTRTVVHGRAVVELRAPAKPEPGEHRDREADEEDRPDGLTGHLAVRVRVRRPPPRRGRRCPSNAAIGVNHACVTVAHAAWNPLGRPTAARCCCFIACPSSILHSRSPGTPRSVRPTIAARTRPRRTRRRCSRTARTRRTRSRRGARRASPAGGRRCTAHPALRQLRRVHDDASRGRGDGAADVARRRVGERSFTETGDAVQASTRTAFGLRELGVLPAALEQARGLHARQRAVERAVGGEATGRVAFLDRRRDREPVELGVSSPAGRRRPPRGSTLRSGAARLPCVGACRAL